MRYIPYEVQDTVLEKDFSCTIYIIIRTSQEVRDTVQNSYNSFKDAHTRWRYTH